MTSEDIEEADKQTDKDVMEIAAPPQEAKSSDSTSVGSNGSNTAARQKRVVAESGKKRSEPVVVNDRDIPSSTPIPPPLNVPIVTHSTGPTEGTRTCVHIGSLVFRPPFVLFRFYG